MIIRIFGISPLDLRSNLLHSEIPKLKSLFDSVRTCQDCVTVISDIDCFTANLWTSKHSNSSLGSDIPNIDVGIPSPRHKQMGIRMEIFQGEYPVGVPTSTYRTFT